MIYKYLCVFVLSLFLVAGVFTPVTAQPQFQQTELDKGLNIFYPKTKYYPSETEVELHFSVFNSSNYLEDNTSTTCSLWIEKNEGDSIISKEELLYEHGYFYYSLNTSQTEEKGHYNYFIYCNSSTQNGALSSSFFINNNGEEINLPITIIQITALIFILGLVLFFLFAGMGDKDFIIKISLWLASWVSFNLFMYVSWQFTSNYLWNIGALEGIVKSLWYITLGSNIIVGLSFIALLALYAIADKIFWNGLDAGNSKEEIIKDTDNVLFKYIMRYKNV